MAYIGTKPTIGNFQICDAISVVNGQAAYTMQVGGVNVSPQSSNHMIVSLNGTIQKPGGANPSFTVSGSTITFASNLATGDVIDFIQILGDVLDLGVPSDATVTAAKIGANAVTAAKLNNDIISGSTELASEPADTDEFLVSDAGTLKRIDYSLIKGGGITELDTWRLTTALTSSSWTLTSNLERADHNAFSYLGTGMTESSGVFTFPSTGYYLVQYFQNVTANGDRRAVYGKILSTHDNSTYIEHYTGDSIARVESNFTGTFCSVSLILDVTDTTQVKVKFGGSSTGSCQVSGNSTANTTYMNFIKLAET
jgi:hypothetical protein